MNLPEPVDRRDMRVSDADRERVAETLRSATVQGRLDITELEERLGHVYAARTYGQLEPLTRDLPGAASATHPAPVPVAGDVSKVAVAVMSGFERKGVWPVGATFTAVAFWGGGEIDLREAVFTEGPVTIRVYAIMGGVNVIVPTNANLRVTGIGVMGGFDHSASGFTDPTAPTITVTGLAFWGGVGVERRGPRREALEDGD